MRVAAALTVWFPSRPAMLDEKGAGGKLGYYGPPLRRAVSSQRFMAQPQRRCTSPVRQRVAWLFAVFAVFAATAQTAAQTALSGDPIHITRATGKIVIDGDLGDEGWRGATRVEKWYETNPGDNVEPKVSNVGWLAYDDKFFYAGFDFADSNPGAIRAPLSDRDNMPGFTDYGGVLIDAVGDGHAGTLFVANARGIQYDSIINDSSNEDSSPDFFWDAAAHMTERGWTLELRIPFSSLRYRNADPQTWGILLYRNWPRDFHYQFFSARLPRGGNCFVCRANTLTGLEHLPSGGHIIAAPYASATSNAHPRDGLGTPLVNDPLDPEVGLDVKWTPNADTVVDVTANPDFSQVESDTAQISANERFALFFPEKRPFFLEGVDLFATPIQAVYSRTITAPRWGGRVTGKAGGVRYTALVADDEGGGSVIVPGPTSSSFAPQEFESTVFIARAKRDIGLSFVSVLVTDRESRDGAGHNRVIGPDFQWRPSAGDVITGQWIFSNTRAPDRADLASGWTGQQLTSHAGGIQWNHATRHFDSFGLYKEVGDDFRTDTGFVPQVGYREAFGFAGWTVRPKGFVSSQRTFVTLDRQTDQSGKVITRMVEAGASMDTRLNGFMLFRYTDDQVLSGAQLFGRRRAGFIVRVSPSRRVAQISLDGTAGPDVDFANSRVGRGATVNLGAQLNPMNHLEISLVQNQQWLNVDDVAGVSRRLFTARVSRIRGVYTFTPRSFVRAIAQYVSTDRETALYRASVPDRSAALSGSALFAYKLNWQSVLFVGYGDDRERSDRDRLEPSSRQFFVKVSYAFQR